MGPNKFNKGDKVVCVDIGNTTHLTLGKIYEVIDKNDYLHTIIIIDDNSNYTGYFYWKFKSIETVRKEKLDKLYGTK